jgi:DNA repair exonuclease SbcCD ATPase subunit/DNA repair exonuclease SbcCD nuclease subunit
MIKIAHFGDVHWRSLTRHKEYRNAFEDAFKKMRVLKPDIILIAGDIVHSKTQGISPELISNLTWWFREMSQIAHVHVTLGNHDGLILNPDREDAISPIVNAINDPNVHLYKKSGVYPLSDEYNLCVFSCFDEDGWKNVVPESGKINIATFHGAISSAQTDEGWSLEGDANVDLFNGFDYALLGDIHKQQFLTDRIAYCGSTIQQNYGEDPGKGFLFWGIDGKDFKAKHIEVKHDSPFVTLDYSGILDDLQSQVENHPERSRFRVRVNENVSQAERTQIRAAIKDVCKPEEIVFKSETNEESTTISQEVLEESEALDNFDTVWSLIREYYSKTNLSERTWDLMKKSLTDAWGKAKISDELASGRWTVKKMEFDNVFGYGENNVVNFDSTEGITGIFGRNRSGKSSICGALTYALFNGTDRGPMKNLHVVNARKNFCRVKTVIGKKGNYILVDRQTIKKSNRSGDINAVTNLNLFECDETGTVLKDLSDEQRRETEKTLRSSIGTLDDFLLTSLASQGDINRFVNKGSAERKSILTRFLRLDILDQLQSVLKTEVTSAKAVLSKLPEKEFDTQIYDKKTKLEARRAEREDEIRAQEKISEILSSIVSALSGQNEDEKYSETEVTDQQKKLESVSQARSETSAQIDSEKIRRQTLDEKLKDLSDQANQIDYEELREAKNQIVDTERSLLVAQGEVETKSAQLSSDKREVKKLSDVPCGDAFPTCKYIVSAKKAELSMLEKKEDLEKSKKYASVLKNELKRLLQQDVDEKLALREGIDQKISLLRQEISSCDLKTVRLESKLRNLNREVSEEQAKYDRMKMNLCDDETAQQREILVKKRKIAEEKMSGAKRRVQSLSEKIGLLTAEIEQLRKDKDTYDRNNLQHTVLNLLHKSLSRDGIPLQIVKKKLPLVNREIANILTGVTGFTVELESDNTGMDIILDYGDSRRIIECCSGMEKMMASLAIRTALIRISSLPKSDILIIDEGFGALDSSNIEACTALLRSLTKTFRSILIISHVDAVKDVVDNVIEISAVGHDSKVEFL